MEAFPEDINQKTCMQQIEKNQGTLIKNTRRDFCEQIRTAVKECQQNVILKFPVCLWGENRKLIARELLERFGPMDMEYRDRFAKERLIKDPDEIPRNVVQMTIELFKP